MTENTIAVLPVTTLQPAIDLKRSVKYDVATALIQGDGIILDTLNKKKVLRFTGASGSKTTMIITPGVADSYNLSFRYYNTSSQVFKVNMQLQAADGTIMKSGVLNFKPLTKGKSSTVSISTNGSINAGNYKVVLTGIDAKGLIISGLEMQ
jgi:beta-galactosidase